jgi:hypothetical protein
MKKNIQKGLNVSLCIAIIMILTGSTVSYGMNMKLWSERDKKIGSSGVIDVAFFDNFVELPHLFAGTAENNPLLWIAQNASVKQADMFGRMHKEMKKFRLSGDDEEAFYGLPRHVKNYVTRLFSLDI